MRKISVLLVDNNRIFLRVLSRFLQEVGEGEVRVVDSVVEGQKAIAHAVATQPHVILLDLNMPDVHGMEVLPRLRERLPQAIIIVLTMLDHDSARQDALATGADGFVSKAKIDSDLLPTIRDLASAGHRSQPIP